MDTNLVVEENPVGGDRTGVVAEAVLASDGGFVVCVAHQDMGGLSLGELDDRIEELGKARSRIEGCLAEVLAERARRSSNRETAAVLRERVLESAGRASGEVKTAVSLAENFPSTLEALIGGEINSGHARVINRVAGKPDYRGEEEILGSARVVPSDLLSRYALRHTPVEDRDYSKYQQQRQDRRAMMTQEPDGSWKLYAHLDYMAGRRVSMVWAKMAEAFRREESPNSKITYLQRNADALVQMITRDATQRAAPANLMVISDYNTTTGELGAPRLDDGQPVPPELLEGILENVEVYTAFVDTKGLPLWLGRSKRSASLNQKLMLAARDGGCIGCNTPSERCEAHHIHHWANGGETNINNLVQLCPGCHHLTHDTNWQVHQNHQGRHYLKPPPDPFPNTATTTHQPNQHNPILQT